MQEGESLSTGGPIGLNNPRQRYRDVTYFWYDPARKVACEVLAVITYDTYSIGEAIIDWRQNSATSLQLCQVLGRAVIVIDEYGRLYSGESFAAIAQWVMNDNFNPLTTLQKSGIYGDVSLTPTIEIDRSA